MPNIYRVLNVWDGGLVFHRRCCRWGDVGSYCCVVGMILICVSLAVATVILYYVVDKYNLVCRLSKDVVCNVRNIDGLQQKLYSINVYTSSHQCRSHSTLNPFHGYEYLLFNSINGNGIGYLEGSRSCCIEHMFCFQCSYNLC